MIRDAGRVCYLIWFTSAEGATIRIFRNRYYFPGSWGSIESRTFAFSLVRTKPTVSRPGWICYPERSSRPSDWGGWIRPETLFTRTSYSATAKEEPRPMLSRFCCHSVLLNVRLHLPNVHNFPLADDQEPRTRGAMHGKHLISLLTNCALNSERTK